MTPGFQTQASPNNITLARCDDSKQDDIIYRFPTFQQENDPNSFARYSLERQPQFIKFNDAQKILWGNAKAKDYISNRH